MRAASTAACQQCQVGPKAFASALCTPTSAPRCAKQRYMSASVKRERKCERADAAPAAEAMLAAAADAADEGAVAGAEADAAEWGRSGREAAERVQGEKNQSALCDLSQVGGRQCRARCVKRGQRNARRAARRIISGPEQSRLGAEPIRRPGSRDFTESVLTASIRWRLMRQERR